MRGPPCPDRFTPVDDFSIVQQDQDVQNALKQVQVAVVEYIKLVGLKLGLQVGISLQVVYDQHVLANINEGLIDVKLPNSKPTPDTVFRIGSITKIFTTMMLSKLAEDGIVDPSDPVDRFYNERFPPAFRIGNPYSKSPVTLRMLAMHSSGLVREPPCGLFTTEATCPEKTTFDILARINLFFPPDTDSVYSNLGMAILGRALARAYAQSGKSNLTYEQYIEAAARQIGMNSSGFTFTPDIVKRMAVGYNAGQPFHQPEDPYDTIEMGFAAPAGGMYSTANDMGRFLKFLWREPSEDDPTSQLLGRTSKSQYLLPGFNFRGGASNIGSHAFEIAFENGTYVHTKGGLLAGFGSSLAFIPAMKLGVIGFININSGDITYHTARVINLLKPVLANIFKSHVPPKPKYENAGLLIGSYGFQGTTVMTVYPTQNSSATNIYKVSFSFMPNADYNLYYDPAQNRKDGYFGDSIGFRYERVFPADTSCLARCLDGESNVMYFGAYRNAPIVAVPEFRLWGYPKL